MEIIKDFLLCKEGDIVTESVAHMCRFLSIIPFEYAMKLKYVYLKGSVIPEDIIALSNDDILSNL